MPLEKHIAENARLVPLINALDTIIAAPFPADQDALAAARWELTCDLLLYFAVQEELAVQPLEHDSGG